MRERFGKGLNKGLKIGNKPRKVVTAQAILCYNGAMKLSVLGEECVMSYEETFLKDFGEWVATQVKVNEMALMTSQQIAQADGDERAEEAAIRYESKLDAYRYLLGKFDNYKQGKAFHDVPDGSFDMRHF